MHAIVICWAAIVVTVFALSLVHSLRAHFLLAVIGTGSVFFFAIDIIAKHVGHRLGALRANVAVMTGPSAAAGAGWRLAWLAYGSLAVAAVILSGLAQFPTEWDSRAYHIPFIDLWLRARTLNSTDSSSWFHPGNNELVGLWCVAPFSGDFLIALNNLPAIAVLGLGTRALARLVGCGAATAELAGLAAVTPHVVTRQLLDSENDVAVAGLFVAALFYGMRFAAAPVSANTLLWSLSLGMLPGVKYYALGYAAVAGLTVTILSARLKGLPAAVRAAGAGIVGMAMFSGYWYVRNWLITGTPIYPHGFLGTPGTLAKTFPHISQTTLLGHRDLSDLPLLVRSVSRSLGPAHCAAFLVAPATMALLMIRGLRRDARRRQVMSAALALAGFLSAFVFATTPFVVEIQPGTRGMLEQGYLPGRFLLSGATLMVLALLISLDVASRKRWRSAGGGTPTPRQWSAKAALRGSPIAVAYGVFVVLVLTQLLPGRFSLLNVDAAMLLLTALDICLGVLVVAELSQVRSAWLVKSALLCALILASVIASSSLSNHWHGEFAEFYGRRYRTQLIEKLAEEYGRDTRICALMYCSYPFFGSQRQFSVAGPVWLENYEALRDYLSHQQPDLIIASKNEPAGGRHYDQMATWLAEHPELFEAIYSDERFALYRLIDREARALSTQGRVTALGTSRATGGARQWIWRL